jgi:hypothetical protein
MCLELYSGQIDEVLVKFVHGCLKEHTSCHLQNSTTLWGLWTLPSFLEQDVSLLKQLSVLPSDRDTGAEL